jgi:RimJ/RimL family protein N-acetyltransferase
MKGSRDREGAKQLRVGDRTIELRPMGPADRDAMLRFARALPQHDLLFLRRDICEPEGVEDWLSDIALGHVTTLLAVEGNELVGYVTLHRNQLRWSRHVAELRVAVSASSRGAGLGRALTEAIFRLALEEGIEKIVARMTPDQKGAIAVFEGLGFRPEAVLRDEVKDRDGNPHDLLVMSHRVADFQGILDAYGVSTALGDGSGAVGQ